VLPTHSPGARGLRTPIDLDLAKGRAPFLRSEGALPHRTPRTFAQVAVWSRLNTLRFEFEPVRRFTTVPRASDTWRKYVFANFSTN
jgi:hypothetical protein